MEGHIFFTTIEGECMFRFHAHLHEMVAVRLAVAEPSRNVFGKCPRE